MGNHSPKLCNGQLQLQSDYNWKQAFYQDLHPFYERHRYEWIRDVSLFAKDLEPEDCSDALAELYRSIQNSSDTHQLKRNQLMSELLGDDLTNSFKSHNEDQVRQLLLDSKAVDYSGLDYFARESQNSRRQSLSTASDHQNTRIYKIRKQLLCYQKVTEFLHLEINKSNNILGIAKSCFLNRITRKIQDKSVISQLIHIQQNLSDINKEIIDFISFFTTGLISYFRIDKFRLMMYGVLLNQANMQAFAVDEVFSELSFSISLIHLQRLANQLLESNLKLRIQQFQNLNLLKNTEIFLIPAKCVKTSCNPFQMAISLLKQMSLEYSPTQKFKILERIVDSIEHEAKSDSRHIAQIIFNYVVINSQIPSLHIDSQILINHFEFSKQTELLSFLPNALEYLYNLSFE